MILDTILDHKLTEVAKAKRYAPVEELIPLLPEAPPVRPFAKALNAKGGLPAIIAEVKKASPSAGDIAAEADPKQVAMGYEQNGASALSVLTDEKFFNGSLDYLRQIRQQVQIPLLRKDFIVDPYQLYEAREAGADAALLIVAALSFPLLQQLRELCRELGMDALVEVHDEHELQHALKIQPDLVGINNRNLQSFEIDTDTSFRLARLFFDDPRSEGVKLVSESGITKSDTLRSLAAAGFHAALIGTAFMRYPDPGSQLREVLQG